jgi:hypothetical protein
MPASEPVKPYKRWKDTLWPIGGTVLGLIAMPVAIAQYPDFFDNNRWLLPLSVLVVLACWIVPLLIHENARFFVGRFWSHSLLGKLSVVASIALLVFVFFVGSKKLFQRHTKHLNEQLSREKAEREINKESAHHKEQGGQIDRVPLETKEWGLRLGTAYAVVDSRNLYPYRNQIKLMLIIRSADQTVEPLDDKNINKSTLFDPVGDGDLEMGITMTQPFLKHMRELNPKGLKVDFWVCAFGPPVQPEQILTIRDAIKLNGQCKFQGGAMWAGHDKWFSEAP